MIEVDGQTKLNVWGDGKCNELVGSDGLLFTPLHKKKEPVSFFVKQICTSLHLNYRERASFRGIDTYIYVKEFEDLKANNMTCYCRKPDACPLKGTMDLFPCVKVPITISHPHFYLGDPSLLQKIGSGLHPQKKKHEFFLNMEIVLI